MILWGGIACGAATSVAPGVELKDSPVAGDLLEQDVERHGNDTKERPVLGCVVALGVAMTKLWVVPVIGSERAEPVRSF